MGSSMINVHGDCRMITKAMEVRCNFLNQNVVSWNVLITGYAKQGRANDGMACFEQMQNEGIIPDAITLSCILKTCGCMKNVEKGQRIHDVIAHNELLQKDVILGNALVDMYAKCGEFAKAEQVLDKLPIRNVVSWSSIISAYVQQGNPDAALKCYERMQNEGVPSNTVTLISVLKACGMAREMDKGKQTHDVIACKGLLTGNLMLGTALVDMYAKCGVLTKAENVLDEFPFRDVVIWNALISGYVQSSLDEKALESLKRIKNEGIFPNLITFICILRSCHKIGSIDVGKEIHNEIASNKLLLNHVTLNNGLVNMYAYFGDMMHAQQVLYEIPARNIVSWNVLISGYVQQGQGDVALEYSGRIQTESLILNAITYACILKVCAMTGNVSKGKHIHNVILKNGFFQGSLALGTAVVDMYAKCGAMTSAEQVLDELPVRNVVAWSAVITGYSEHGREHEAILCFERMQCEGLSLDSVTLILILKVCGSRGALTKGEQIHNDILRQSLENDIGIGNALVDMYAKCGALEKARQLFEELPYRKLASWNSLMAGYVQHGQGEAAINCFETMENYSFFPDAFAFSCALKACAVAGAIDKGKEIHQEIVSRGMLGKDIVLGVSLIDMYAKCGRMVNAQNAFDDLIARDEVTWNTLIAGYTQHMQGEDALNYFELMQIEGMHPDVVTFICIASACSSLGAIGKCIEIHNEIVNRGILTKDPILGNALVDMYAKCGDLINAQRALNNLPDRDVVSWNALMTGFAQLGQSKEALTCFNQMQEDGICPDSVTFLSLIYACGHSGLLDEGVMYLMNMEQEYGVLPGLEHYTCMVDLLSRAGCIRTAIEVIREMPFSDLSAGWIPLLSACRNCVDVELGRSTFDRAVEVDRHCAAAYLLMSKLYTAAGLSGHALDIDILREKNAAFQE